MDGDYEIEISRDIATRQDKVYVRLGDNYWMPSYPTESAVIPGVPIDPALTVDAGFLQAMMEALWREGYRPKGYSGTAEGETQGLRYRQIIEDLRASLDYERQRVIALEGLADRALQVAGSERRARRVTVQRGSGEDTNGD